MNNDHCNGDQSAHTLHRFHHRFVFWVSNLYAIESMQVVNFRAGLQQTAGKDGHFWGRYELLVAYRRNSNESGLRQKSFTRGYLFTVPGYLSGLREEEHGLTAGYMNNYICEAEFSCQFTPLIPSLFPLLSRFKYVPFKAVVSVHGMVCKASDERAVEQEKCCMGGCACLKEKENADPGHDEPEETAPEMPIKDSPSINNKPEAEPENLEISKQRVEIVDLELIALERENNPDHPREK